MSRGRDDNIRDKSVEYREVDLDAIAKQTANEGYIYKIK